MNRTTPKPKIHFRRLECKYVISERQAAEVARYIRPYVTHDPHAEDREDPSYVVLSLYLDSPDLRLFRETEEGILDRIKLRIRRYDYDATSNAFLEIKRKHNRLVLKDRARLTTAAVSHLVSGGAPNTTRLTDEERYCYDEFSRLTARYLARPVVWVRYRREAWVGAFDRRLRITLDRDLACAGADHGADIPPLSDWRPIPADGVVLELKFDGAFPAWLAGMVRKLNLMQRSFSKYARSVRAR